MKQFVFIFRSATNPHANVSAEEMQERIAWISSLTSQNKLAEGNRISGVNAKTLKPGNVVADGPYSGSGEFVSGYVVVKTDNIDEALELAKTNPMLKIGGTIEIRQVFQPGDKE